MIQPEGFANARHLFACAGVLDPMGFSVACQPDPGLSVAEIAETFYDAWVDGFLTPLSKMLTHFTFLGVHVTKTTGGQPVVGEHLAPLVGTTTFDGALPNTAMLVRKNTGSGGRRNRGRMFVPPYELQTNQIDQAGNIDAGHVAALQTSYSVWLAGCEGNGTPLWLLHSHVDDAPTPISSLTVQSLCATQRRRMR